MSQFRQNYVKHVANNTSRWWLVTTSISNPIGHLQTSQRSNQRQVYRYEARSSASLQPNKSSLLNCRPKKTRPNPAKQKLLKSNFPLSFFLKRQDGVHSSVQQALDDKKLLMDDGAVGIFKRLKMKKRGFFWISTLIWPTLCVHLLKKRYTQSGFCWINRFSWFPTDNMCFEKCL